MMCKMYDNPRVFNVDSLNISSSDDGLWRKKVWRVWFNPMKQNAGIDMLEMEMKYKRGGLKVWQLKCVSIFSALINLVLKSKRT